MNHQGFRFGFGRPAALRGAEADMPKPTPDDVEALTRAGVLLPAVLDDVQVGQVLGVEVEDVHRLHAEDGLPLLDLGNGRHVCSRLALLAWLDRRSVEADGKGAP